MIPTTSTPAARQKVAAFLAMHVDARLCVLSGRAILRVYVGRDGIPDGFLIGPPGSALHGYKMPAALAKRLANNTGGK